MKKYILQTLFLFFITINLHSQITIRDIAKLAQDSIIPSLSLETIPLQKTNIKSQLLEQTISDPESEYISSQSDSISLLTQGYNISRSLQIDSKKSVGKINYTTGALNGSASINVPIEIPQASFGFTPSLALVYNSMSTQRGSLGYGWGLSGLSQINRVNDTYYHNKAVKAIANDSGDSFILDNIRLIRGLYSDEKQEFISEQGNIKVIGYRKVFETIKEGTTKEKISSFSHFEVFYPDGSISTYGFADETKPIINYPITQITTLQGDTCSFSYDYYSDLGFQYRITKINYGKNNEYSIGFRYRGTGDLGKFDNYIGGYKLTNNFLIEYIDVKHNSETLKTYKLSYSGDEMRTLTSINLSSGSESFNSLAFVYGDGKQINSFKDQGTVQLTEFYRFEESKYMRALRGKLEYGSSDDCIIVLPNRNPYVEYKHYIRNIYDDYKDDEERNKILISAGLKGSLSFDKASLDTGTGFVDIFCTNLDDSGNEQIIKVNNTVSEDKDQISFTVYTPSVYSLIQQKYIRTYSFPTIIKDDGKKSIIPKFYYTGDFNGDGRMEVLAISSDNAKKGANNASEVYLFDLENDKILYQQAPTWFSFHSVLPDKKGNRSEEDILNGSDRVFVGDFDGDGKTDFCLINENGTKIYTFYVSDTGEYTLTNLVNVTPSINRSTYKDRDLIPGDFNGDGRTDLLLSRIKNPSTYSTWSVFYSRGDGTFDEQTINIDSKPEKDKISYQIQDIDKDGNTDLVQLEKKDNSPINAKAFLIKNGKVTGTVATTLPENSIYVPINLQSRNISTMLLAVKPSISKEDRGQIIRYGYNFDSQKAYALSKLTDSFGMNTLFSYERSNNDDGSQFFRKGYDAKFPFFNYADQGLLLAKSEQKYLNDQKISDFEYIYTNPVMHKQGLGFCGFQNIYKRDNNNYNKNLSQTYDPYNFGVLNNENTSTSEVSYQYKTTVNNNKSRQILLEKQVAKDKLKDVTITYQYTYDTSGNKKSESVDYGSDIKSVTSYEVININNTARYIIGLQKSEQKTNTRNGKSSAIKINLEYNDKYLPSAKKSYYNNNLREVERYEYDSSNNLKYLHSRSYTSTDSLTTEYKYDNYGRKIKEIDPLKLSTDYSYDNKGHLEKVIDHKGNITAYDYDVWGRNIKKTYADGTIESLNYSWFTDNIITGDISTNPTKQEQVILASKVTQGSSITACKTISLKPGFSFAATTGNKMQLSINSQSCIPSPQGGASGEVAYVVTKKVTGDPDTQLFYDALDREIRSGEKSFDGKYLFTDIVYDNEGKVQKTSLPSKYKPVLWNTYNYDEYGRITSLNYASGKKDSYSYDKLKTISIIDGLESTTEYDTSGETKTIRDAAGTITYNLRPDGQPESIIAPGSITTTFQYDTYGRQISIVDPSAGSKSFGYDTAGNINKETDARGKVTNLKYDRYNRLISKEIVNEFLTTYKYNADSQIESESSTNGTSKTYTYDNLLRLKTQKESIVDGKWLEQTYGYRSDGNIGSIAYSSQSGNIATENYEYTNGHHTELKLNNSISVWKLLEENDLGMPTASKTGVIDRKYTYDTFGLPAGRILKNGNNTLQNFGYKFDAPTGNLTWRKDNTRNIQEDFLYDELNRLTNFNGSTIKYNSLGNITDHSTVGAFTYDKTKPYAIATVAPYANNLYKNSQDITYNALMRPASISENGFKALFSYDKGGNRVKMNLTKDGALQLNRYYIGGLYEIDETLAGNTERLYLGGDAYSAAAVYIKEGGSWNINYIGRDYLGSITHVVDATGVVRQELSYDPWGRLRDPLTQALFELDKRITLVLGDRGYTAHEHLQKFGLINMNARLYDPVVGRFLSPDPYVQAPDFSQNFNRYSYAYNNPFRYTDPSGEWFGIDDLIAAVIGGLVNLGVNIWQGNITGAPWEMIGKGAAAFGAGAVAGDLALYGPGGWAAGGAIVGATNSALSGGNFGEIVKGSYIGSLSSIAGGFAGQFAASSLGAVVINGFKITSPVIKGAVGGFFGGAGGGYVGGFTAGFISTGNFEKAHEQGMSSMKFGSALGTASGMAGGYRQNQKAQAASKTAQGTGKYSVYEGIDPITGEVKYVGMTGRNPEARFSEHLNSGTSKAELQYRVVKSGIGARIDARIYEQGLINKYGIGNLHNKINSIAPKYWGKYGIE